MTKRKNKAPRVRAQSAAVVTRGDNTFAVALDLGQLELPEREFEADSLHAVLRLGAVSIILDQWTLDEEPRVQTRVEVRLSLEAFGTFFAAIAPGSEFNTKFGAFLKDNPMSGAPPSRAILPSPADGRVVFRAHAMRLSHVGSEAEIAFYGLPIGYVSLAIQQKEAPRLSVTGILKVTTTTHAMARLLDECHRLHAEIEGPSTPGGK